MENINIVEQSVESVNIHDAAKKIEFCGRVCYKSEDKITESSNEKFVKAIIKSGHCSVLEHFHIVVRYDYLRDLLFGEGSITDCRDVTRLKFLNVVAIDKVEGNVRAWREFIAAKQQSNSNVMLLAYAMQRKFPFLFDDLVSEDGQPPEKLLERFEISEYDGYKTLKIVTNRGVTHELVRHRVLSFSQESTRYCNYLNRGFAFVVPKPFAWAYDENSEQYKVWLDSCNQSVCSYNRLLELGCKPQEARDVLNNSLKAEIVMTGTYGQWQHFLYLRDNAKTVQPEAQFLADLVKQNILSQL